MAMDIIFKNETNFGEDNNFSIDLTSNNYIQEVVFKEKEEWLVSGLELNIETIETKAEYAAIKKMSDLINDAKKIRKTKQNMECFTHSFLILDYSIMMSL